MAAAAVGLLTVVVTARGLGADGRGIYALVSLAATIAVTLLGGAATALAAEIAHRRAGLGQLQAASLSLAAAGAAVTAVVMVAMAALWTELRIALFAAVAAPFLVLVEYQMALFQARGELRSYLWVFLAKVAAQLAALLAAVLISPGNVMLALGLWAVSGFPVALLAGRRQLRLERLDWRRLRPLLHRLVTRGAPVSLANGLVILSYRIDILVVAALLPLSAVGVYSVAVAAAEALLLLPRAVAIGAYHAIITRERGASVLTTARSLRHGIALTLAVGAVAVPVAHLLVGPIFGSAFASAAMALTLLLPGMVALGLVEILRPYFLVRLERSREFLSASGGTLVANALLAFALVPWLGIDGAALATTLSYGVGAAFLCFRFVVDSDALRARDMVPGRAEIRDYLLLIRTAVKR